MDDGQQRLELTLRLWRSGSPHDFEEYVQRLLELLPRHHGRLERRAAEVEAGPGNPDAVLQLSFPSGAAVDSYLRDPLRGDLEELASGAVARSLITDARTHDVQDHEPVDVVPIQPEVDDA